MSEQKLCKWPETRPTAQQVISVKTGGTAGVFILVPDSWDEFFYGDLRMKGTELLYQEDSYLREFDARVVSINEHSVLLDRTAFYPRGGGQMSDRGWLSLLGRQMEVIAVEKRGSDIYHTVEGELPQVGDEIRGKLDWAFRYHMMRTHSALHVLCGIIYKRFGAQVTGCQMYQDRARMDFSLADLTPARIREIERLSNEAIRAGYPVKAHLVPRAHANLRPELIRTKFNLLPVEVDPVRTVEIVGLDLQADGGTHVANTLEIASLKVTKTENKGRENRRLEIEIPTLD